MAPSESHRHRCGRPGTGREDRGTAPCRPAQPPDVRPIQRQHLRIAGEVANETGRHRRELRPDGRRVLRGPRGPGPRWPDRNSRSVHDHLQAAASSTPTAPAARPSSPTTAGPGDAVLRSRGADWRPTSFTSATATTSTSPPTAAPTKADITLLTNKTLDPASPDYKWEEGGVVASSDGVEDCNAIDPGVFLDPNTKRLWLTYGSYFGYIRLVELDPRDGQASSIRMKSPETSRSTAKPRS